MKFNVITERTTRQLRKNGKKVKKKAKKYEKKKNDG